MMELLTRESFVKKYYPFVASITSGTGIFPQTLLSQAIIESQAKVNGVYYPGQSGLAKKYNNYFGIKADSSWKGKSVNLSTGEVIDGKSVVIKDNFRVYNSVNDSIKDYVNFLLSNPRYAKAGVFTASTPEDQAKKLQKAGYATSPTYADTIINVGKSIVDFVTGSNGISLGLIGLVKFFFYLIVRKNE